MKRRYLGDDLTVAYFSYAATWLQSWPMRRRLRRSRIRRNAAARQAALARLTEGIGRTG